MKKLGAIIGVSEGAISQYETGKRQPDNELMLKLAEYFNCSVDYLLRGNDESKTKGITIPVLGDVAAGLPIEAVENIIGYEDITPELAATGEFFGLRIKGHSMEPRMMDGDVVIVRKQPCADNGQIAVVLVNGDSATVKKIKRIDSGLSLIAFNPAYEPQFYTNEEIEKLPVNVIGVVVELRAKF